MLCVMGCCGDSVRVDDMLNEELNLTMEYSGKQWFQRVLTILDALTD